MIFGEVGDEDRGAPRGALGIQQGEDGEVHRWGAPLT